MKGLLHRLAARAAGTAVVVRSDARLPYGAVGLEPGDASEPSVAWAPKEMTPVAAPPREPAQPSRSNIEAFQQDAQEGALSREPATFRPTVPDATPLSREAPPLHRARASTPAVEPVVQTTEASHSEPPRPMLPPVTPAAPLAKRHEPAAMLPAPPARGPRPSAAPARNDGALHLPPSPPRGASVADPAPLLPAAPHPAVTGPHLAVGATHELAARRSTPGQPQIAWPLASATSAADEPTEVHIHIGRIDVTAVHEAPKARKPSARAPSLSLDAYLAGRSKA